MFFLLLLLLSYSSLLYSFDNEKIEDDIKKRLERQQIRISQSFNRNNNNKGGKLIAQFHPYNTIITSIYCDSTLKCLLNLSENTWCKSGVVCINNYCHKIPHYPCNEQTETCDEDKEICITKSCTFSSDCNDNLYCNGREKCINRTCMLDIKGSSCDKSNGLCDEKTKTCIYPYLLQKWKNHTIKQESSKKKPIIINKNDNNGFSIMHHGNHSHHENREWIPWVVIAIAVILFFTLVFLMVSVSNRGNRPVPIQGASVWAY